MLQPEVACAAAQVDSPTPTQQDNPNHIFLKKRRVRILLYQIDF
jgi:hypothetical protein